MNSHLARKAIRMLRDELELSQHINSREGVSPSSASSNNVLPRSSGVLHSQSIVESNEAAAKYLSKEIQSTNDDYILACALMENEQYKSNIFGTSSSSSSSAGGVVIITLDNNLSCKALANDLKVHSPSSFVEYYEKRMESLKQRAASRLA